MVNVLILGVSNFVGREVDDPESCFAAFTALGLFHYILLTEYFDFWIVEFTPHVQVVILDKWKVMAWLCVTIVHTDSVQVVRWLFILNIVKDRINFVVQILYLGPEWFDLRLDFALAVLHQWLYHVKLFDRDRLVRVMKFDTRHLRLLFQILLLLRHKLVHVPNYL